MNSPSKKFESSGPDGSTNVSYTKFSKIRFFRFIQVLPENQEREPTSWSSEGKLTAVAISKSMA